MSFVPYYTQYELIVYYKPVYPYEAVTRIKFTLSIRLTAVILTAVKLKVWGLDGTVFYPYNRTVQTVLYGYGAQPYLCYAILKARHFDSSWNCPQLSLVFIKCN